MRKSRLAFWFKHFLGTLGGLAIFVLLIFSQGACAVGTGNACSSGSSVNNSACDTCISSQIFQTQDEATAMIGEMFSAINAVLDTVQQDFFNGVINGTGFQTMIATAIMLYIAMYGVVIFFSLGSYRVYDVVTRLVKIAIVYMMTSPAASANFNTWFSTPFVGGMNQLIKDFTSTAESGTDPTTLNLSSGLDASLFEGLFSGSINQVLSPQYATAILSIATTGFFGWFIALFMIWSVIEFVTMLIGALVTYAKCLIGLAFLFGIAPLFFIFLLFEKTQSMFWGWFNMVLGFALQPVLLFSFLGFYAHLLDYSAANLLTDPQGTKTDFCWVKWFSMPGALWDSYMWRPTLNGAQIGGEWHDATYNTYGEPISVLNLIYFAVVCHLGNKFAGYVGVLSSDLSGGNLGVVQPYDTTAADGPSRAPGDALGLDNHDPILTRGEDVRSGITGAARKLFNGARGKS